MQKHVKVYLDYFGIGEQDIWICEACMRQNYINNGFDIHHIWGRGEGKDVIESLMCLCRKKCHDKAASMPKSDMQLIHNYFLSGARKKFFK